MMNINIMIWHTYLIHAVLSTHNHNELKFIIMLQSKQFLIEFIYSNTQKYIVLLPYNGVKHSNIERYAGRLTLRRWYFA